MAENNDLRSLFHKIAKEKGYGDGQLKVEDVTSRGVNYTSTLHLATISAPQREDLELFAKVANLGETLRATGDTYTKMYETERIFYSKLAVAFERLYNKHNVPTKDRIHLAKHYGHQVKENLEIIVLENLMASGFVCSDRFKSFDWDYAEAAVKELSKFHALGITAKEENLEEYHEMKKIDLNMFHIPMKDVFISHAHKIAAEMVEEQYKSKLKMFFMRRDLIDDFAILWKTVDDGFIIHSDYRPSNLMHQCKNGRVEVIPVDFQTMHCGSLVVDLLYFIWLGSDSKFRENHYHQLIELYYSELTTSLRNLHIDINEVYPRKTFERELDEAKTLGLLLGLALMPILSVDPDDAPTLDCDEAVAVKPNQVAMDKINEILSDYVKWGII